MRKHSTDNLLIKKHRVFFILLYPDSTSYSCDDLLDVVKSFKEYGYILHDKDTDDNGVLKKPHYHCVIRTSPCCLSTILNKFPGLPSQCVEFNHEFKWCFRYFVHFDDDTKYQYSADEIVTNVDDYRSFIRYYSEVHYVSVFCSMRGSGSSWSDLLRYARENSCYDVLRRNFGVIKTIAHEIELTEQFDDVDIDVFDI